MSFRRLFAVSKLYSAMPIVLKSHLVEAAIMMKGSTPMNNYRVKNKIRFCLLFFLSVLLLIYAIPSIGRAQETVQFSGVKAAHVRKATLEELYAMFFVYAEHVETQADADEKFGIDRTFYRQHLQRNSGLPPEQYAHVLASARRFVAVNTKVNKQIADMKVDAGESGPQGGGCSDSLAPRLHRPSYITSFGTHLVSDSGDRGRPSDLRPRTSRRIRRIFAKRLRGRQNCACAKYGQRDT